MKHHLNRLCFYVWSGSMDGLKEKSEDSLLDELTTYLLSASIPLFPTFSLSISSPPTCSHSERGINPSHFHYLSTSISIALSLPLHSGHSLPIEHTSCRHKWACDSPVPQQSYHVLIRSILTASLILLHPSPSVIGHKPLPTCQQESQYKYCNLMPYCHKVY